MADFDAIFKAYDVRGIVPDQWDADAARRIGAAFAAFAGSAGGGREQSPRVLVARDMRPSGVDLVTAFAEGVTSTGADVVDLGLASTDLIYFAAGKLDSPAAMFTASHNPAQYNGIKFCLAGASPVGEDTGLAEIKAHAKAGDVQVAPAPGAITQLDLLGDYADHVRSFVDVASLRPLRIVADTANGMGGLVVPKVFGGLPFDLEILFPELDGTFPNHPADPTQHDNLKDLQARVVETGADVGLAFDGDADRVVIVDNLAEPVSGIPAMLAASILDKHAGGTESSRGVVIHNLICSKAVPEVVREHGGTPIRSRVGHSFIKAEMAKHDAVFGCEHSAHYYFRDNYRADSGLIAAMLLLEIMSLASLPLSDLRKQFERYADSGEINTKVDDPKAVIERVAAGYPDAEQDRLDGLTVDLGDWWFNVRPSNTEPLLRLNLEAQTRQECEQHVAEVVALIEKGS